tara:strand:- start:1498 stop:1779 length:282 start_codon:yes stop_codon:yes gene_type:complete
MGVSINYPVTWFEIGQQTAGPIQPYGSSMKMNQTEVILLLGLLTITVFFYMYLQLIEIPRYRIWYSTLTPSEKEIEDERQLSLLIAFEESEME